MKKKSVLCINSLTAVGKCGLATTVPILSALGINAEVLPTILLATIPNIEKNSARQSNSIFLGEAIETLKQIECKFNCIYSGFLESESQLKSTNKAFDIWKEAIKIVDPVMGDNGKIYSLITPELVNEMCKLCSKAQIITPNVTESLVLLEKDITKDVFSLDELKEQVVSLQKFCNEPVITGVKLVNGDMVVAGMCKINGYFTIKCNYIKTYYPGSGDLFTSVLTGLVTNGDSVKKACERAVEIVEKCVNITSENNCSPKYGLWIEAIISDLAHSLKNE